MSRKAGRTAPKTEAGKRTIPMPPDVVDRLRKHLSDQTVTSFEGFVFTAARGGRVRYDNWRTRTWRRIADRVGLDVHPHDLRHTCATRLIAVDRWQPSEVQAFLGHSDPRMTLAVYTHIETDALPTPSTLHGGRFGGQIGEARGHLADT